MSFLLDSFGYDSVPSTPIRGDPETILQETMALIMSMLIGLFT